MYDPLGASVCQAASHDRDDPHLPRARGARPRLFPNTESLQLPACATGRASPDRVRHGFCRTAHHEWVIHT